MHDVTRLKGWRKATPNLQRLLKLWNAENYGYTPERLLGIACREYSLDNPQDLNGLTYYTVMGVPFNAEDVQSLKTLLAKNGLT